MRVKNLEGTSDNVCSCPGGWLGHWRRWSEDPGRIAPVVPCAVLGCPNPAEKGGHVQEVTKASLMAERLFPSSTGREWLIVPLCNSCNGKPGAEFELRPIQPAKANKAETCESGYRPY